MGGINIIVRNTHTHTHIYIIIVVTVMIIIIIIIIMYISYVIDYYVFVSLLYY